MNHRAEIEKINAETAQQVQELIAMIEPHLPAMPEEYAELVREIGKCVEKIA